MNTNSKFKILNIDGSMEMKNNYSEKIGESTTAKVYAVTSGKGGTGKTSIAVNLSIVLSRAGMRVLLIDADMGLANIDLLTGVYAKHSIEEVIDGDASIFDALAEGPENLTILPASSGLGSIEVLGENIEIFKKELIKLENAFDFIFIDTGAGISANVVDFVFMSEEVIVVMTPEPTAFADAYAMAKLVSVEKPGMQIGIIVNIVQNEDEGAKIFAKLNEIVKRFLGKEIRYRGCIYSDKNVADAVMRQIPLAIYAGKSPSMQSIREIARNILGIKTAKKKNLFSR